MSIPFTLKTLRNLIKTKSLDMKIKDHQCLIAKYFADIKSKKTVSSIVANHYYKKTEHSKIHDCKLLKIIEHHMIHVLKIKPIKITIADFNFEIYESQDTKSRPEVYFKLNLFNIVLKLRKYFNNVNINFDMEKPTIVNHQIMNMNACLKPDVKITIGELIEADNHDKQNNQDNQDDQDSYSQEIDADSKPFEIVLEYNEKKSHKPETDESRKYRMEQFCDSYIVFDEKKKTTIIEFYKKTIFDLIKYICSLTNNKYILAKIIFWEGNKHKKNYKTEQQRFNKLLKIQEQKSCDFEDFYNQLNPKDEDGNDISLDDFIELLETEYGINVDLKENQCNHNIANKIIMNVDPDKIDSEILRSYKNLLLSVYDALMCAAEKIIEIERNHREKRYNLPKFMEYYTKHDLDKSRFYKSN